MIKYEDKEYTEQEFLAKYIEQKTKENDEKEKRVKMEMVLLETYGDKVDKDKLSKQFKEGRFIIKISRNISYKLTDKGWDMVYSLPENERPVDIKYNHTKGKMIPGLALEEIENETKPSFSVTYQ